MFKIFQPHHTPEFETKNITSPSPIVRICKYHPPLYATADRCTLYLQYFPKCIEKLAFQANVIRAEANQISCECVPEVVGMYSIGLCDAGQRQDSQR